MRQNDNTQNFDRSSGFSQNAVNFDSRNSYQGEKPNYLPNGQLNSQLGPRNEFSDSNNDWRAKSQTFGESRNS